MHNSFQGRPVFLDVEWGWLRIRYYLPAGFRDQPKSILNAGQLRTIVCRAPDRFWQGITSLHQCPLSDDAWQAPSLPCLQIGERHSRSFLKKLQYKEAVVFHMQRQ